MQFTFVIPENTSPNGQHFLNDDVTPTDRDNNDDRTIKLPAMVNELHHEYFNIDRLAISLNTVSLKITLDCLFRRRD